VRGDGYGYGFFGHVEDISSVLMAAELEEEVEERRRYGRRGGYRLRSSSSVQGRILSE